MFKRRIEYLFLPFYKGAYLVRYKVKVIGYNVSFQKTHRNQLGSSLGDRIGRWSEEFVSVSICVTEILRARALSCVLLFT